MNMLTRNNAEATPSHIAQAVIAVEDLNAQLSEEKQQRAKQLLDNLFPLERGSHQDVAAYVIDYCHIVAFFKDGQHTGLRVAKHFIGYNGEPEKPTSLLFRDGQGSHLELTLDHKNGSGSVAMTRLHDMQLETCMRFPQPDDSAIVMRHWVSLLKGNLQGNPIVNREKKEFHSAYRDDYVLMDSFID